MEAAVLHLHSATDVCACNGDHLAGCYGHMATHICGEGRNMRREANAIGSERALERAFQMYPAQVVGLIL